ncbi:MAG: hypothetical protein AAF993_13635, partial [Pseudomonadota bacterium]
AAVARALQDQALQAAAPAAADPDAEPNAHKGTVQFFATDGVARFRQVGRHFLGAPVPAVSLVDI